MNNNILNTLSIGTATLFTISQTNEVFQIIQMVITILSALFIFIFNIWKWYIKAKKDGKVTPEEIDELIEITKKEKK